MANICRWSTAIRGCRSAWLPRSSHRWAWSWLNPLVGRTGMRS